MARRHHHGPVRATWQEYAALVEERERLRADVRAYRALGAWRNVDRLAGRLVIVEDLIARADAWYAERRSV